jgi:ABC-type multidrug transport system ATPase subunit
MSIIAEKVTKTYGNQHALNGVSFQIEKGQIVLVRMVPEKAL